MKSEKYNQLIWDALPASFFFYYYYQGHLSLFVANYLREVFLIS